MWLRRRHARILEFFFCRILVTFSTQFFLKKMVYENPDLLTGLTGKHQRSVKRHEDTIIPGHNNWLCFIPVAMSKMQGTVFKLTSPPLNLWQKRFMKIEK